MHMPDAEVRRQRAAYLKGVLRTAAVSAATLALVAGLGIKERLEARRADRLAGQKQAALTESRHLLYASDMNVVAQAWDAGDVRRALDLLEAHRPARGEDDLRGFEWRYLWGICQGDSLFTLPGSREGIACLAFSP